MVAVFRQSGTAVLEARGWRWWWKTLLAGLSVTPFLTLTLHEGVWPDFGPAEWHWPSLVVPDVHQQQSGGLSAKRSGWGSLAVCSLWSYRLHSCPCSQSGSLSPATCFLSSCYWSAPPCAACTYVWPHWYLSSGFTVLVFRSAGPQTNRRVLCPEQGPHLAIEPRFLVGEQFPAYAFHNCVHFKVRPVILAAWVALLTRVKWGCSGMSARDSQSRLLLWHMCSVKKKIDTLGEGQFIFLCTFFYLSFPPSLFTTHFFTHSKGVE